MSKTVLLTLGRLPKALEIARSFARAGWRVIVAEPFRWHLSRVSNAVARSYCVTAPSIDSGLYLRDILRVIEIEHVELVVPISEEAMYASALHDLLPAGTGMFTMPQNLLLTLHSKHSFNATSAALGLDVPETYELGDPRSAELALARDFIVKPIFSCSGRGIRYFKAGAALPDATPLEREIVQERVAGNLYSTFSIVHGGRPRVTVIYRAAVLSGTVAVCFERVEAQPAITAWVERFAAAMAYSGFLSFDFIVDAGGRAMAIECNPRATSGAHFVHPDDLARAIFDPQPSTTVRFRQQMFLQQIFPCLTETQKSYFSDRSRFRSNLRHLLSAHDVTWGAHDPLPLLTMPFTASQIIARSIAKRESFGEASTFDITWREPAR
jgi:predicted ATP-grasp superfamily ATP-dependent carboligase